ncbi:MAG: CoA-binding protein [Hyphomicrobium sp.]|nr:CoA-binding protein [Hyphomicrobium sp.]
MTLHRNPADRTLKALLKKARAFAVVGASDKPDRPSYGVMAFLLAHGYRVVPVNPGLAGQSILGQRVYGHLADVPAPIDVVDIFRAADAAMAVVANAVEEAQRLGVETVWMQLGVINEAAAAHARAAGLKVVMDRCPKIEIAHLGVPPKANAATSVRARTAKRVTTNEECSRTGKTLARKSKAAAKRAPRKRKP